jgi:hypothetical protein
MLGMLLRYGCCVISGNRRAGIYVPKPRNGWGFHVSNPLATVAASIAIVAALRSGSILLPHDIFPTENRVRGPQ